MEEGQDKSEPAAADRAAPAVDAGQMRLVLEISRLLAVPTELDRLLQRIVAICCKLLDCDLASIFLHDKQTDELTTRIVMQSKEIRVPKTKGIVGHSFCNNLLVHVPKPYEDPRFNPEPDRKSGTVTRSLLACPIPDIDGHPLGVVEGLNKRIGSFDERDFGLIQLLAEQAGVALQRHQFQQTALQAAQEAAVLGHELDLARKIQESLTPQTPPRVPGLNAIGWMRPASQTGGDCFDLWQTSDGRLGVLVADATGHGLGAALVILQVRSLVRAIATITGDPHQLLGHVNARLYEDLRDGKFVTAFLAFVSGDGLIHWSSAGHGPVYMRPRSDQELVSLEPPALPLGVDDQWGAPAPPPVRMDPTGSLLVVSDGIFEACNAQRQLFEVSRMVDVCDSNRQRGPEPLLAALRDAVRAWERGSEPIDDQTIVIVQRDESGKSS